MLEVGPDDWCQKGDLNEVSLCDQLVLEAGPDDWCQNQDTSLFYYQYTTLVTYAAFTPSTICYECHD